MALELPGDSVHAVCRDPVSMGVAVRAGVKGERVTQGSASSVKDGQQEVRSVPSQNR